MVDLIIMDTKNLVIKWVYSLMVALRLWLFVKLKKLSWKHIDLAVSCAW